MAKNKRKNSLQSILKFNYDDLEANRAGYISPEQNYQIKQETLFRILSFFFPVGKRFLLFLFYAVLLLILNRISPIFAALLIILSLSAAFFFALARWTDYRKEMADAEVFSAQGAVWLYKANLHKPCYLIVNNQSFQVTSRVYEQFSKLRDTHKEWAIYYLPKSHVILSAERL